MPPSTPTLFPSTPTSAPITAHCDGGARGNPGPAGYGVEITDERGEVLAELSEFLGIRTNNFAEYSGLLASLDYALTHGHKDLRVISDSELMVKQIHGKYKVNSPDLKPLWQEAKTASPASTASRSPTPSDTKTRPPIASPTRPWTAA